MAWWCHVASYIWINIGTGNGLLPDGIKPLPETLLTYFQLDQQEQTAVRHENTTQDFSFQRMHMKLSSAKCQPFCSDINVLNAKEIVYAIYGFYCQPILSCVFHHTQSFPCDVIMYVTFVIFDLDKHLLTHWGREKMATILQTIFSNAFSWIFNFEFWIKFLWNLFRVA